MKLREYLIEDTNKVDISMIKRDCKKWLDFSKGLFVYRGIKIHDKIVRIDTNKNRKPKDTPLNLHKKIDEIFYKKFGWKPRSEGVFCTGNISTANLYGEIYVIFPIGDFEILWSEEVEDLYIKSGTFSMYASMLDQLISAFMLKDSSHYSDEKGMKRLVDTYKNKDLYGAIKSENEIMIKCDQYYAISVSYIEKIYKTPKNFVDFLYGDNNEI